jgi:hypothetical protein
MGMNALRRLALLALWILNFCAWWFAITLVWWERVRRPGHEFLPNGLPLMGFSMALVINTLMGFAVRGLFKRH